MEPLSACSPWRVAPGPGSSRFAARGNSVRIGDALGWQKRYSKTMSSRRNQGLGLHLRYAFEPGEQRGASLGNPLFELLAAVIDGGSIRHAAQALGCSYRYVWGWLRKRGQKRGE